MSEITLTKLREPFPINQISKLPKPTKSQTDEVKADFKKGIRCTICGGWHHKDVIHLDYVGHAALTDRLLDTDSAWNWEPLAVGQDGYPVIDKDGGMWIRLTVLGVSRLGYGDAQGKSGGDAMKERIGDALRNAAMRFGAALDLWHKGDLHLTGDEPKDSSAQPKAADLPPAITAEQVKEVRDYLAKTKMDEAEFLSQGGYQTAEQIYASDFVNVIRILKNLAGEK